MNSVELLAPAKDLQAAMAAVDYGADAVYIGGAMFGARHAAANSVEQIARVADYAHRYGVRVHATLNTLIYDHELEAAEKQARELIAAGIDALIVQDMAFRRMDLPVELHASTQVCNMTPENARFLGDSGFARVILERALSLEEIRAICAATTAGVECFIHGAICVGYSGRCFLSRSMSERSGNRGACSQPCRQTYDLTDGRGRTYIAGKHLLSVRDLNLSARVGELLDAGVRSFKIEGRLKDLNYIKNVVAYYRRAVDEALAAREQLYRSSVGESIPDFTPDPAKSFTRGESEYFFSGRRTAVASFDTPKAVGEYVGRVARIDKNRFYLDRAYPISPGDGVCFLSSRGLVGSNVNAVEGACVTPNRMEGITPGAEVYRNYDHRFNLQIERSRVRRVIPASALVGASADGVSFRYTDCEGVTSEASRSRQLEPAKNPEANAAALRTQAMKSGDTIFAVHDAEVRGAQWFVPVSLAAGLRREGLEGLLQTRMRRKIEHRVLPEGSAVYPSETLSAEENVTNRLAEAFYRDHGVQRIERGLDLA
uniref:peptidase U32 family protein n=1 Tax=uncultured Alistipes sp. TaxID=538949 RepID=UPI0027D9759B